MNDFTIVIPVYNSEYSIINTIMSINKIKTKYSFEVIFVDDCSTDNSITTIKMYSNFNYKILSTPENSGKASQPRNIGIENCDSKYIIFLDSDDTICSDIDVFIDVAEKENLDCVRGYVHRVENGNVMPLNKVTNTGNAKEDILRDQSTTSTSVIKLSLLIDNNIRYDENIKLGEDTIFLVTLYSKCEKMKYLDKCISNYIITPNSITSSYKNCNLEEHINVWNQVENILKDDVSYFELRGQIYLNNSFKALDFIIERTTFLNFSSFLKNKNYNSKVSKYNKLFKLIKSGNYDEYLNFIGKKTLLINGYDLKFINQYIPYLEKKYIVLVDEWTGHNSHKEKKSLEFLKQADIIFCEWFLGNVSWYTKHKKENQKLIVRLHRFELTRDFYKDVDLNKIDKIIAVSYYFKTLISKYIGYESNKIVIIPNSVDFNSYKKSKKTYNNIGIIGILPDRKGFLNALIILNGLLSSGLNLTLNIYGKLPNELKWVKNDLNMMEYYNECYSYIEKNKLENNVNYVGWVDTKEEIWKNDVILSVSDDEEIPESFHLAPLEGFASGIPGIFNNWRGCKYIYPEKYIFDNNSEIIEIIKQLYINNEFDAFAQEGIEFCKQNYELNYVIKKMINEIELL